MATGTKVGLPAGELLPTSSVPITEVFPLRVPTSSSLAQLFDLLVLCLLAITGAVLGRGNAPLDILEALHSDAALTGFAIGIVMVLASKRLAFYGPRRVESIVDDLSILLKATALSQCLVMTSLFMRHKLSPSPIVVSSFGASSLAWMLLSSRFRYTSVRAAEAADTRRRNVLIVGYTDVGRALCESLKHIDNPDETIVGFLDDSVSGGEILGKISDIEQVIRSRFIDQVYITTYSNRELVKTLTFKAPSLGVDISVIPDLFDGIAWSAPVDHVGHFPVLVLHRKQHYALQRFIKRSFDVFGAAIGLVITAPLLAVMSVLIKLDSPGPVLYRSSRVGRKGRIFTCYKLRSMVVGAEERLQLLSHLNERTGPLFKLRQDPRVTRMGRWIRKYSVDEVPQLFNVLIGQMSLVGPRPPALDEYRQFKLEHLRKLDVIPGITGLWQVTGRRDPSFQSYICCDLEYIENWSLWLDLEILARTAIEVLRGTGV